ncbi:hypothetical protein WMY93_009185 [Mugilogobius chulae]|uniref:Uncharacterized protein n=1 Tax=Mugilogobius chulae TaxID=88201 RepID=A0AAW0PE77_9GOBI
MLRRRSVFTCVTSHFDQSAAEHSLSRDFQRNIPRPPGPQTQIHHSSDKCSHLQIYFFTQDAPGHCPPLSEERNTNKYFRINRRRAFALAVLLAMAQRRRRRSRFWVHPINQQRRAQGDYYHLVQELRLDSERHHQYFRMSVEKFEELLSIIGPELRRQCTTYRASIEPQQRLAVALR